MLIVVEGPSGAGKSSLAEALPGAVRVCESSATSPAPCLADFTRQHSDCLDPIERFMLDAARTAVKARAAATMLADGNGVIVVDRFEASLHVLGAVTLGLAPEIVTAIVGSHITRGLRPDLTIFLDCDHPTYQHRTGRREDGSVLDAAEYGRQREAFRRCFEQTKTPSSWIDTSDLSLAELSRTVLATCP